MRKLWRLRQGQKVHWTRDELAWTRRVLELKSYREVSPYLLKTSQKQSFPYAFLISIQGADLSQQFDRHGQTSRFQSDKCHCNAIL